MSTAAPPDPSNERRPSWVSVAVGVAMLAAAVLLFALLRGDGDPSPAATTGASGTPAQPRPVAATREDLVKLSETRGRPLYWAGEVPEGGTYELTRTSDGSVYVRYLDPGVGVGDPRPNFLTIGTYPQSDALKTVREAAKRDGAQTEELDDEGLAVSNRSRPKSWYFAFPDSEELIEVYAPQAGRARKLIQDELVVPVEG